MMVELLLIPFFKPSQSINGPTTARLVSRGVPVMAKLGWISRMVVELLLLLDMFLFPIFHFIMNFIVWNSRGVLKPNFQKHVRDLVGIHNPAIMVIMETRLGGERAREITDRLPFDGAIITETIGRTGGLWLLWNSDMVEIDQLATIEQEIHVEVKVLSSNLSWFFTAIYASPRREERSILWNNLSRVPEMHNKPWVIAGDFNEPLVNEDKLGGRPVSINRSLLFKECLDRCNMVDLGFNGPRFTWTNKRDANYFIQERIDRYFMNPSWCLLYPEARISHLTRCHSDHCPVLLETLPRRMNYLNRPFRFQSFWLSDPSFPRVVSQAWKRSMELPENIENFAKEAKLWNKNHFGNIFAKKRRIMARLDGVQRAMANNPSPSLILLESQLLKDLDRVNGQETEL